MSKPKGNTDSPANGGNHHERKSSEKGKVAVAGKEYPIVRGAIKMDRRDAESISLSDFPPGSIVEFPDKGAGFHVQAIQKITKTGAEVVILTRTSPDDPMLLDRSVHFGLAANLIRQREEKQKDIQLLVDHCCEHSSLVAAVIPCKGHTVGAVVAAGEKIFSDTLSGLESIEKGVVRRIQYLEERGILPGPSITTNMH
ncbi:MAG: hypothetical protein NTU47_04330 [Ignavibacteriales bacterium]|nr:hypothetical protein [Ignavibacteriales bacterium]